MALSWRITSIGAVLLLLCGIALRSWSTQEARAAVSDSAEGLQSQIDAILDSTKKNSKKHDDPKRFDDLISELQIPDNSTWFASKFGDDLGAKLAAKYKESWDNFQDTLSRSFLGDVQSKPKKTLVTVFGSSSPFAQANLISIQQNAKSPLTLYEVVVLIQKRGRDVVPGLYVYADGAFRVLNWATLYELPNVKRQRIRIGGDVEQAKLLHQVNPVFPSDAIKNHVQGTVQLRVVIDVDGNVEQVEQVDVLSGPPELAPAVVDAVKQWRYQPTTLNGDPVEVDTTVVVNFSAGS